MLLMLDYDGTLTPIVDNPSQAKIHPDRKAFLEALSRKHTLAIVTGRDMSSFRGVFGTVPNSIFVATSHGASIYKGVRKILKSDYSTPDLKPLLKKLKNLEGVMVEEKEGCFALHYRNCRGCEDNVKRVFKEFIDRNPPRRVIEGKKVLEAIYGEFDKGNAVRRLVDVTGHKGSRELLYIGDDSTDLYAFRAVKELGGKTAFVGSRKPEEADILLKNVDEVYEFLSGFE